MQSYNSISPPKDPENPETRNVPTDASVGEAPAAAPVKGWSRLGQVGTLALFVAAMILAGASRNRSTEGAALDLSSIETSPSTTHSGSLKDWSIYKFTIPVANGTADDLLTLVNSSIAPVTYSGSLGCNSLKVVATAMDHREFHFVDAAKFASGPKVCAWRLVLDSPACVH